MLAGVNLRLPPDKLFLGVLCHFTRFAEQHLKLRTAQNTRFGQGNAAQ